MKRSRPRPRPDRRRAFAVRAVGWLLVLTGSAHAALVAAAAGAAVPAGERAARRVMADTSVPVGGLDRTLWQLFTGFSLAMALLLVAFGALNLLVVHRSAGLLASRALLWLDLVVVTAALVIALLLLPVPPIVLLGLAACAACVGLLAPGPDTAGCGCPRTPVGAQSAA